MLLIHFAPVTSGIHRQCVKQFTCFDRRQVSDFYVLPGYDLALNALFGEEQSEEWNSIEFKLLVLKVNILLSKFLL